MSFLLSNGSVTPALFFQHIDHIENKKDDIIIMLREKNLSYELII